MMFIFIGKRFVNILAKITMQFALSKRENIKIVKSYHLNALLMIVIY